MTRFSIRDIRVSCGSNSPFQGDSSGLLAASTADGARGLDDGVEGGMKGARTSSSARVLVVRSATGLRSVLADGIPKSLVQAVRGGIGLFITLQHFHEPSG